MFVATLGMDNFDCTKMNAHFKKIHSLSTGGAHSQVEASITSPISPPYVAKQLTVLFPTQLLYMYSLSPGALRGAPGEDLSVFV